VTTIRKITLPRNHLAQALLDEAKRRKRQNQAEPPVEVQPNPMDYGETNMKSFLEVLTARSIKIAIEPTCYANPKLPHSLKSENSEQSGPKI